MDSQAKSTPPPEITWLYSHCRAIGMNCKSCSGKWEEDIALWTANLADELSKIKAQMPVAYADPNALATFEFERKRTKSNGPYQRKWMWANPADKLVPLYRLATPLAAEPSAWIIDHPDGVVTLLRGKTIPGIYAQYATPLFTRLPEGKTHE